MGREAVLGTFTRMSANADIAVIEGVMGLYDGASPTSGEGSTAEIAKWLGGPVLLVIDASGMARPIGAIGRGFADFDQAVNIAGVICNQVGSRSHLQLLREALAQPPVPGAMPKSGAASFPKRHLGLRTADENAVPEAAFASWGELVRDWCNLDSIIALARQAPALMTPPAESLPRQITSCKIGIAFDEAFHFYYEDNLRRLGNAGAELVYFSPIHDEHLPLVDGLYIRGGYPELHAAELAANELMRQEIQSFASDGGVIYAECGGLMYLCSALRALDGIVYPMCDVLPGLTTMCERLQALGYVEIETVRDSILGHSGLQFKGHQFRYSNIEIEKRVVTMAFCVRRRRDRMMFSGYQLNDVLGFYVHAHWASNASVPSVLVEACSRRAQGNLLLT
ncbi:MAG TPA: cobyrinate a,c-diamide synthase [Candidatus Binataceae bacterium]|nr:cobyrinate a,c-diamide synthase [Candidatus Binataceae bacterium]